MKPHRESCSLTKHENQTAKELIEGVGVNVAATVLRYFELKPSAEKSQPSADYGLLWADDSPEYKQFVNGDDLLT